MLNAGNIDAPRPCSCIARDGAFRVLSRPIPNAPRIRSR
ncbi:hypothetical protein BURPS1106B_2824 [Burkholderia pseudomallei 1106b]|uniref:Uncharacterized protein n=1 Tax=Burkholderia pseudomallei (strain 1106a) TaxID=357348 RepID=A3P7S8_BURP0|nr:hypothetical protein BURPS1106A_A2355 [Burkholderia pseudomallei 1106a]EES21362.1 hypothetical protein BURPS1106B_2824 [Burkholderia pseudomallei 1106b]